jgi:hypothetical protein
LHSSDDLHAILASKGIIDPLLSLGIILPATVHIEAVGVSSGLKTDAGRPGPLLVPLHRKGIHVPTIEIPCQRDPLGLRRMQIKSNCFCFRCRPSRRFLRHIIPPFTVAPIVVRATIRSLSRAASLGTGKQKKRRCSVLQVTTPPIKVSKKPGYCQIGKGKKSQNRILVIPSPIQSDSALCISSSLGFHRDIGGHLELHRCLPAMGRHTLLHFNINALVQVFAHDD